MLLTAFAAAPAMTEPEGLVEPAMSPVQAAVPQALLLDYLADKTMFTLTDAPRPGEYAETQIDGAVNVPHDRLEAYADELPAARNGTVLVYCRTGKRVPLAPGKH